MFPGLAAHLHNRSDFLAGVLCVIIVKNIFKNGKIVLTFSAVHIIIDGDKTDIISRKYEILQAAHVGILAPQPGQVFDNQRGNGIILHIFHHFQKSGPLKIRTGESIVHKKYSVAETMLRGIFGQ